MTFPLPFPPDPYLPPPSWRSNPNLMTQEQASIACPDKYQRIATLFHAQGDAEGAAWATAVVKRIREWRACDG